MAPRRVLHVISSARLRGAEVFAVDLIAALGESGVDQRVAVLQANSPVDVDYGVETSYLSGRKALSLRRILRRWRPDVVQAHGGDPLKCCVLAGIGLRIPVVYRNIGLVAPWARTGLRRRLYSVLMGRADRIVALAEAVATETRDSFGVPPERVVMIPNAVDPERLETAEGGAQIRRAHGIAAHAPVVLSIASLTWEKDPLLHIEATGPALQSHDGAFHLLAGDGPLRPSVENYIAEAGLSGRVRVLGYRRDVADLLAAADVVLFASRADGMEGMPTVLIEAGMAGRPVVGFAVAGASEVVVDGDTGILVPPGDVGALSAALGRVLGDPDLRERMGHRARAVCLARFDIRAHAPRYRQIYEELAASTVTTDHSD